MAAPTYTTDLADINLVTVAGGTTNWTALGGGASGLVAETDFYIQGDACMSKGGWNAATKGMIYNYGSGITVASGSAVFMWLYMWAPNALDTEANGGIQIIIGSSTSAYKQWYVRGSDTYPYGGWVCVPVDPTVAADATTGSPSATLQYFGALAKINGSVTKGQPLGIDAFRHGRQLKVLNGDLANGYGTFAGAATTNDSGSNRWGLFQAIDGGYLQQGLFLMGDASTAVDFRDSNRNIAIANTKKVGSTFNTYEIRNASSRVDWTAINISALGTVSPGEILVTDNATFNVSRCNWTSLGAITLKSNSTLTSCIIRTCKLITQNTATLTSCTIIGTNDSVKAMLSNDPSKITYCEFVSGGTKHALELNTAGTYSLTGNNFTGYGPTVFGFHTTNDVSSANDTVTKTTHGYTTGMAIEYRKQGGSAAIGLTDATVYYVRAVDANTLAFYTSASNANTDTSRINLTASGTDTHYVSSMDAAIYNNSGGAVTLNISGGNTPSIRNGSGASTTVNSTVTVTLSGLIANSEVVVFTSGTETELASVEDSTTSFAFGLAAGTVVDIFIHNVAYYRADIMVYTIPSQNTTIPIQQRLDPNYVNN